MEKRSKESVKRRDFLDRRDVYPLVPMRISFLRTATRMLLSTWNRTLSLWI